MNHYDVCHQVHARMEERYLFPEFVKIERKSRWDVSLYEKEHEKIESLFENISNDLQWLSEQQLNESQLRRNIIALLDMEKTFKGLTEHHEEREENGMLKDLDEQLDQPIIAILFRALPIRASSKALLSLYDSPNVRSHNFFSSIQR